jgi:hypothetical protein
MDNNTLSLKELVRCRYESQKRIRINNHIISILREEKDIESLILENEKLKNLIKIYNIRMKKYSYNYQLT